MLDILTLFSLILRNRKKNNNNYKAVQSVFVNYIESLAQVSFFRDTLAFGWAGKGIRWPATKWLLVHPLHLAENFALIHGQHGSILPHLLEHSATLKLIARLLEVVPEELKQREMPVIRKCGAWEYVGKKKKTHTHKN